MIQAKKSRPGSESKAAVNLDNTSVPNPADILPAHAGLVHGCFVAVVQVRGTEGAPQYRRRVLLSLKTAQRAVDRATADGLDASVVLCQLMPAGGEL